MTSSTGVIGSDVDLSHVPGRALTIRCEGVGYHRVEQTVRLPTRPEDVESTLKVDIAMQPLDQAGHMNLQIAVGHEDNVVGTVQVRIIYYVHMMISV